MAKKREPVRMTEGKKISSLLFYRNTTSSLLKISRMLHLLKIML